MPTQPPPPPPIGSNINISALKARQMALNWVCFKYCLSGAAVRYNNICWAFMYLGHALSTVVLDYSLQFSMFVTLTLIRMTKDEKGLAFLKGLLL